MQKYKKAQTTLNIPEPNQPYASFHLQFIRIFAINHIKDSTIYTSEFWKRASGINRRCGDRNRFFHILCVKAKNPK